MSCYNTSYNYYQNTVSFIFNGFFSSRLLIRDKNLYYKDFNEKHSAFVYHDVIMQTFSKHAQQYVVCESKAPRAHNYWPVLVGLLLGHCWYLESPVLVCPLEKRSCSPDNKKSINCA